MKTSKYTQKTWHLQIPLEDARLDGLTESNVSNFTLIITKIVFDKPLIVKNTHHLNFTLIRNEHASISHFSIIWNKPKTHN